MLDNYRRRSLLQLNRKALTNTFRRITFGIVALNLLAMPAAHAQKDDSWQYVKRDDGCPTQQTQQKTEQATASGDWLTPGTKEYQVAETVFKILTDKYGFSGAAAAGLLGNIKGESDFQVDLAEGGRHFGMNGTANISTGGGGGLFQFTPFTKFTNSPYFRPPEGWAIENQIDFMWDSEFAKKSVWPYMQHNGSRYGVSMTFSSLTDFLSASDPAAAADAFQIGYERPAKYHPERRGWAQAANTVFNTANIQASPSKWLFTGENTIDATNTPAQQALNEKCGMNFTIPKGMVMIAWMYARAPEEEHLAQVDRQGFDLKGSHTKPELEAVLRETYKIKPDPGGTVTASCDRNVALAVIASGLDKDFPWPTVEAQYRYMLAHPDKWMHLSDPEQIQPGDILSFYYLNDASPHGDHRRHHTAIYLGEIPGQEGKWFTEASYYQYEPMRRHWPGSVAALKRQRYAAQIDVFRFVGKPTHPQIQVGGSL